MEKEGEKEIDCKEGDEIQSDRMLCRRCEHVNCTCRVNRRLTRTGQKPERPAGKLFHTRGGRGRQVFGLHSFTREARDG